MAILTPHTVTSYDDDLHRLRAIVGQMGALAESQMSGALVALAESDGEAARAVVALDRRFDALQSEAEWTAMTTLARNAPLADDLREVLAGFKIAGWLERAGDEAKNIARRAALLSELPSADVTAAVIALGEQARHLLRMALAAHLDRDLNLAAAVIAGDVAADAEYLRLFDTISATCTGAVAGHLQLIAKNIERIADLATNIAEQVVYAASGQPGEPRPTA